MYRAALIVTLLIAVGAAAAMATWIARRGPDLSRRHATSTHLNVRLGWLVNANSAGQVVASARGFYADEGLDVTLHAGGLAESAIRTVAAGSDDLGFANGPELVIAARAAGAPLKLAAVVHPRAIHGFIVRADSDIRSPADWSGHRVGIKPGSPTYMHYLALSGMLSVDRSSIVEIPLRTDMRPFLVGELDVYPGSVTNEALAFQEAGIPVRVLVPEDFGLPTMGHVVFATETFLQTHTDDVSRFLRATQRGWEWCRTSENRDLAVDYLLALNPQLDRRKERRALEAVLPLVGDFSVDHAKLGEVVTYQYKYGGLPRSPSVDDLVFNLH